MVLLRICMCSCVFSLCKSFWILFSSFATQHFLLWFINSALHLILFSLLPWVSAYVSCICHILLISSPLIDSITKRGFCRSHAHIISLSTNWLLCRMAESVYRPSRETSQLESLYFLMFGTVQLSDFCHFENC